MKIKTVRERNVCGICNSSEMRVIYSGRIRSGGIGSDFVEGHQVNQCVTCDFVFLNRLPEDINSFYESNAYREAFDYEIDISSMQKKFDPEQHARINRIGIENVRGKVVADFGAGPGIFIDAISAVAQKTIVVEPSQKYRDYLSQRGHKCFPYADQMLKEHTGQVDVVVSFDTIEHIPNVSEFTKQIHQSLKTGGVLYLSMPNLNDLIRSICPSDYNPFYFQVAHVNYFSKDTAARLLKDSGFANVSVDYIHKYNINNIFQWCKNGKPGAFDTHETFDRAFHSHFIAEIERLGVASHLFITATK